MNELEKLRSLLEENLPILCKERDVFPRDASPDTSISRIVGLEGDLTKRTPRGGVHGWALTKVTSYSSEKMCCLSGTPSIATRKFSEAVRENRSGAGADSCRGVARISGRGVGWREIEADDSCKDKKSTTTFGGCFLYRFSHGMVKSAGVAASSVPSPTMDESRSSLRFAQILDFLPKFATSSV